jgi:hypothetical protein
MKCRIANGNTNQQKEALMTLERWLAFVADTLLAARKVGGFTGLKCGLDHVLD